MWSNWIIFSTNSIHFDISVDKEKIAYLLRDMAWSQSCHIDSSSLKQIQYCDEDGFLTFISTGVRKKNRTDSHGIFEGFYIFIFWIVHI